MTIRKLPQLILSAALILVAVFVHFFYVDYRASTTDLIFELRDAGPNNEVTAQRVRAILSRTPISLYEANTSWYKTNAPLTTKDRSQLAKLIARHPYGNDPLIAQILIRDTYLKNSAASEKLRQELISNARRAIIPFGIEPSDNIGGPERLRKRDAFWLGIILPLSLLTGALCCLAIYFGATSPKPRRPVQLTSSNAENQASSGASKRSKLPPSSATAENDQEQNKSLATMLIDDLGDDFPVSTGNGKRDDPLHITAMTDYVSVEYAVVTHVLSAVGEEYKLSKQRLITEGDRHIDELVFDVRTKGSNSWAGTRKFYFDISAGF